MKTLTKLSIATFAVCMLAAHATLAGPVAGVTHSNTYTMDVQADRVELGLRHNVTASFAVDLRAVFVDDLKVAPHVGLAFTGTAPLSKNIDAVWGFRTGATRFTDAEKTMVTVAPHVGVNLNGLTFGIEHRTDIIGNQTTNDVAFIVRLDF